MLDLVGSQYESVVDCCEHDNEPFEFNSGRRISLSVVTVGFSKRVLLHGVSWQCQGHYETKITRWMKITVCGFFWNSFWL